MTAPRVRLRTEEQTADIREMLWAMLDALATGTMDTEDLARAIKLDKSERHRLAYRAAWSILTYSRLVEFDGVDKKASAANRWRLTEAGRDVHETDGKTDG